MSESELDNLASRQVVRPFFVIFAGVQLMNKIQEDEPHPNLIVDFLVRAASKTADISDRHTFDRQ